VPHRPHTATLHQGGDTTSDSGAAQGDDFGRAIAGGTDVDRDGRPDILVGAPFEGIGSTHAPPRGPGEITLFSGNDGRVLLNVKGESARGKFGASVAFLPDMNGDRTPDLLVGAPGCSPDERRFGGRVYLVSGKDGAVLRRIDGRAAGEALGSSVAALGDLDADGVPDILAGAPNAPDHPPQPGNQRGQR
jgi:hypothetical protein